MWCKCKLKLIIFTKIVIMGVCDYMFKPLRVSRLFIVQQEHLQIKSRLLGD